MEYTHFSVIVDSLQTLNKQNCSKVHSKQSQFHISQNLHSYIQPSSLHLTSHLTMRVCTDVSFSHHSLQLSGTTNARQQLREPQEFQLSSASGTTFNVERWTSLLLNLPCLIRSLSYPDMFKLKQGVYDPC